MEDMFTLQGFALATAIGSRPERLKLLSCSARHNVTDFELRGQILQAFYIRRDDKGLPAPNSQWVGGVVTDETVYRICRQLSEYEYLDWHPSLDGGCGRITAAGCDVIEGHHQPGIAIQLTTNNTTNITDSSLTNVIVGNDNTQKIQSAFDELVGAVNSYAGSDSEKEESRNLLAQLAKSPVFAQVIGQLMRFGLEHLA